MVITAIIGITVTLLSKQKEGHLEDIKGLTIDTLDYAMEKYKGGKPNFVKGKKAKSLPVLIDETIPHGKISISQAAMDIMKANIDDLIYMADSRWILGGLRSDHVYVIEPHAGSEVKMSKSTFETAMFLEDKLVTLEKIF